LDVGIDNRISRAYVYWALVFYKAGRNLNKSLASGFSEALITALKARQVLLESLPKQVV